MIKEEFEHVYREEAEFNNRLSLDFTLDENGDYINPCVYVAYWAWQERLDHLTIELPKKHKNFMPVSNPYEEGYESGYNQAVAQCRWKINRAGVSVVREE